MKDGGAQAVKLEGGAPILPQVEALSSAGIPVIGHLGLTPQSVHSLGGYRVQGRGEAGEILIPIAEGVFHRDDIRGELADLCAGRCPARQSSSDITLFKSVGAALGDLATAHAVYKKKTC